MWVIRSYVHLELVYLGPREAIHVEGSPLGQAMFWVPRSGGVGLGISVLSYSGRVWLGLAADPGLVPDLGSILDGFYAELDAMLDLVRQTESPG